MVCRYGVPLLDADLPGLACQFPEDRLNTAWRWIPSHCEDFGIWFRSCLDPPPASGELRTAHGYPLFDCC